MNESMPPLSGDNIVIYYFQTNNTNWDTHLSGYSTCFIISISLTRFNGAKITWNSLYNKSNKKIMSLLKPLFFSITWQMKEWMSEYFNEHICFNSKSSFASPSFHKLFNIMMLIQQHENQDIFITLRKWKIEHRTYTEDISRVHNRTTLN